MPDFFRILLNLDPTTMVTILLAFGTLVALLLLRIVRTVLGQPKSDDLGLGAPISDLAARGMTKSAQVSIERRTLLPTLGLRFMALVGGVIMVVLIFAPVDIMVDMPDFAKLGILLAILYFQLRIQFYQLSYDSHEIIARNAAFARVTIRWRDLMSVTEGQQHELVLKTDTGQSLRVIKKLVGMGDFVEYARHRMRENAADLCPSFQKSKPFGVA